MDVTKVESAFGFLPLFFFYRKRYYSGRAGLGKQVLGRNLPSLPRTRRTAC